MSRTICRFWQQGNCRYGSNCRFDHPGEAGQQSNNRFSALSNGPSNVNGGRGAELPYHLNKEVIQKDLTEERPQWILSAYGPGRDAPEQLFGGYPREQSFEEIRLHFLQAELSGNTQGAKIEIDNLYSQSQQQIQTTLNDLDRAIQYVIDAGKKHPNRIDICKQGSQSGGAIGAFGSDRGNTTSAFGATANPFQGTPSAFGAASSQPLGSKPSPFGAPAFGQVSQPTGTPAFGNPGLGQPTQLNSAFGQPSALGAKPNPFGAPAFGQPAQLTSQTTFGQTSQPGNAFSQPQSLNTNANPFAAPSASASPSPFAALGGVNGAGPPNAFEQAARGQSSNPFGQPAGTSASNPPFGQPVTSSPFGQPTSTNSNPFGQPQQQQASNPFGAPVSGFSTAPSPFGNSATPSTVSPFGANRTDGTGSTPFQQPAASGISQFGQPVQQPTAPSFSAPAVTNAFATAGAQGQGQGPYGPNASRQHPRIESYSSKGPDGRLRMFKGKAVTYVAPKGNMGGGEKEVPVVRNFDGSVTRIWFPDGPPMYTLDTEATGGTYDSQTIAQWAQFVETGKFAGGLMPEVPPKREWCVWDF